MDDRIHLLAAEQHGVFSRDQARALGYTRGKIDHRVERRRWEAVAEDIFRVVGSPTTEFSTVMGIVLSGGPDAVASGSTALALHGIRGFEILPAVVVVPRRPPRRSLEGVRESFRLPDNHRTVVNCIPTATVARALFDAARRAPRWQVEQNVDACLAARRVTQLDLSAMLGDLAIRGRDGIQTMRDVIEARVDGAPAPESRLESRFLELLRTHGVREPHRQFEFTDKQGWVGRCDFAWPDARLIVETDGATYHDSATDRRRDDRRDARIEAAGWTVLRFGWNDVVHRPTSVIRILRTALRRAS